MAVDGSDWELFQRGLTAFECGVSWNTWSPSQCSGTSIMKGRTHKKLKFSNQPFTVVSLFIRTRCAKILFSLPSLRLIS